MSAATHVNICFSKAAHSLRPAIVMYSTSCLPGAVQISLLCYGVIVWGIFTQQFLAIRICWFDLLKLATELSYPDYLWILRVFPFGNHRLSGPVPRLNWYIYIFSNPRTLCLLYGIFLYWTLLVKGLVCSGRLWIYSSLLPLSSPYDILSTYREFLILEYLHWDLAISIQR